MTTEEFILEHRLADVRSLALQASRYPEVDLKHALQQIAGWQTARRKLPSWAQTQDVVYPPSLSMEQCSSEATAQYKSNVAQRACLEGGGKMLSMTDLTGGFGVDFSFLARHFSSATYVERNSDLCATAKKNFEVFHLAHANVVCGEAEAYLGAMERVDFIYLDPARRDANGGKTYAIEDCSPDVKQLHDALISKARVVMIKLSPMLDWRQALRSMPAVTEVHMVSVGGECKELLLVLCGKTGENAHETVGNRRLRVFCVNDEQCFSYALADEQNASVSIAPPLSEGGNCLSEHHKAVFADNNAVFADNNAVSAVENSQNHLAVKYLFEPNASVMKAGCFNLVCQKYGVKKVGKNSNLYVSAGETADFCGRRFVIERIFTLNKRDMKSALQGIAKANVAVRNFPLTAEELRKRLKLRDGGDVYIFGTTDSAERHVVLLCRKA